MTKITRFGHLWDGSVGHHPEGDYVLYDDYVESVNKLLDALRAELASKSDAIQKLWKERDELKAGIRELVCASGAPLVGKAAPDLLEALEKAEQERLTKKLLEMPEMVDYLDKYRQGLV